LVRGVPRLAGPHLQLRCMAGKQNLLSYPPASLPDEVGMWAGH